MKIEETETFGWKLAIKGLRAPMNSWYKSDSVFTPDSVVIGEKDNILAKKLIKAGGEHRKFLRLIHIQAFLTLPRYIWTELDTYKVGTTRMSCSTMHKLGSRHLIKNDFEGGMVTDETLSNLNGFIDEYMEYKTKDVLISMKRLLPEGFLQSAVYDMSYETAINIYHQRKRHKMPEWSSEHGICKWIESLPMMEEWLCLTQ